MPTPEEIEFLKEIRSRGWVNDYQIDQAHRTCEKLKGQGMGVALPQVFVQLRFLKLDQVKGVVALIRQRHAQGPAAATPGAPAAPAATGAPLQSPPVASPVPAAAPAPTPAGPVPAPKAPSSSPVLPGDAPAAADTPRVALGDLYSRIDFGKVFLVIRKVLPVAVSLAAVVALGFGVRYAIAQLRSAEQNALQIREPTRVPRAGTGQPETQPETPKVGETEPKPETGPAKPEVTLDEYHNRVLSFLDTEDYAGAMKFMGEMPASLKQASKPEELQRLRDLVKTKALETLEERREEVIREREAGNFDKALYVLAIYADIDIPDVVREVKALRDSVETVRVRKAVREKVTAFQRVLRDVDALVEKHQYREASQRVRAAVGDGELKAAREPLQRCRIGLEAIEKLLRSMEENLREKVGRGIHIAGKTARLEAVDSGFLKLKRGKRTGRILVAGLDVEDFEETLGLGEPEANQEQVFGLGALCLYRGDRDAAEEWFAKLAEDHAGAKEQREVIRSIMDTQALDLLAKMDNAKRAMNVLKVRKYGNELLDKYGSTEVVQAYVSWINEALGKDQ